MLFMSSGVAEYIFYLSPIAKIFCFFLVVVIRWEAGIETVDFLSDFLKLYTASSTISFLAPFALTT